MKGSSAGPEAVPLLEIVATQILRCFVEYASDLTNKQVTTGDQAPERGDGIPLGEIVGHHQDITVGSKPIGGPFDKIIGRSS